MPSALAMGTSRFGVRARTPPCPSHWPSCSRNKLQKDCTGTFIAVLPRTAPSSKQRQVTVHMPARLQHLGHWSPLKHHSHVFVRGCSSCFPWLSRPQRRLHQQNQSCFEKQVGTQQSLQGKTNTLRFPLQRKDLKNFSQQLKKIWKKKV